MIVPQTAWSLFNVRFHLVDSMSKGTVPLLTFLSLLPHKRLAAALRETAMPNLVLKPLKKLLIALNIAAFEHGGVGAEIVVSHFDGIAPRPHTVPQGVPDIPQQVQGFAD